MREGGGRNDEVGTLTDELKTYCLQFIGQRSYFIVSFVREDDLGDEHVGVGGFVDADDGGLRVVLLDLEAALERARHGGRHDRLCEELRVLRLGDAPPLRAAARDARPLRGRRLPGAVLEVLPTELDE